MECALPEVMDTDILSPRVYCSSDLALHLIFSSGPGYWAPRGGLSEDLLGRVQTQETTAPFLLPLQLPAHLHYDQHSGVSPSLR